MLGEDLDIGFYAEDAYAAYITQVATVFHIIPEFHNPRGATVDVVFEGPFMTEAAFQEAALSLPPNDAMPAAAPSAEHHSPSSMSTGERPVQAPWAAGASKTVVLHAWIEKLNGPRKVQLTEPVQLLRRTESNIGLTEAHDVSGKTNSSHDAAEESRSTATAHHRVLGNLDFLLHLSARNLFLGESNASQDSLTMDRYGASFSFSASATSDDTHVACSIRNALEQRDDVAVARNAVATVIKFAQLAEEHAGKVATVYVDAQHGDEYLRFDDE
ncbi:hypothetical protein ABB37_03785 [Leptomonas pyrrhocoris]|uniref:Uncharacterized protein n=1 Tax=Leptomonas pyrrhocoris TaxID=157538 RepID=A0A0N0DW72_LEPPY|nr:hypothetical protein ABB37_03785 [Leptomonas pyrrhocoris]KPA81411.1 hypothetical protein ABB37_03785 [Leptomonas pyrrhocoris]|eukprot:XP_015659850.1 hypothetical protein ABB37_03785 [Leptomonas pyrrhocoris]